MRDTVWDMTTSTGSPIGSTIHVTGGPMQGMVGVVVAVPMGDTDYRTVRFDDDTQMIIGCSFIQEA